MTSIAFHYILFTILSYINISYGNVINQSQIKCYVCSAGEDVLSADVDRQFPGETVPVCDLNYFGEPKLCPPRFKGCVSQYYKGGKMIRKCGEVKYNTCEKLNNVKYCFCTGDLCNGKDLSDEPFSDTEETPSLSDDEDLSEGSGRNILDSLNPQEEKTEELITLPTTTTTTTSATIKTVLTTTHSKINLIQESNTKGFSNKISHNIATVMLAILTLVYFR